MKKRISFRGMWDVFKNSFRGLSDDRILKLSAALAYYTVFSMGPLLLMIISLTSIFFGREAVEGRVYTELEGFIGHDTAIQLQEIIKNAAILGKGKLAAIIGGVALVLGATSVFAEIQDSINMIWGLKLKPRKGLLNLVRNRLLSFSVIVGLGFLLLVSLVFSAIVDAFSSRLQAMFPHISVLLFYVVNVLLTFVLTTVIFGIIFKILPDAKIKWNDVFAGAFATAFLFMLGKFAISFYISKSHIGTTFGAAGSLVVLLLWIYYSSVILYIGAEFTKNYAVEFGDEIYPSEYAVTVKEVQVEANGKSVQEKEKSIPHNAQKEQLAP
jgi:membrane protein